MADNTEDIQPDFRAASGSKPIHDPDQANFSFSSPDGRKIYLNFYDPDSTALSPSTGTHLRFSVTKITGAIATTVTPSSTFIDSSSPKTLQLILSDSDRVIDSTYSGAGVALTSQSVRVSYNSTGFGTTVAKLSDNDADSIFDLIEADNPLNRGTT